MHSVIDGTESTLVDGHNRLCVIAQLSQLYVDLSSIFHRDPEQELTGVALSVVDHLFVTASRALGRAGSSPVDVAPELISPETLEAGTPVRAIDAFVVTGQILTALGDPPVRRTVRV